MSHRLAIAISCCLPITLLASAAAQQPAGQEPAGQEKSTAVPLSSARQHGIDWLMANQQDGASEDALQPVVETTPAQE